jgi:hypothetical protein
MEIKNNNGKVKSHNVHYTTHYFFEECLFRHTAFQALYNAPNNLILFIVSVGSVAEKAKKMFVA